MTAKTHTLRRDDLAGLNAFVSAQTDCQRVLADLWAAALELDAVGIDDDFFDLGGNSRKATELFAAIAREQGVQLPLATLYDTPTIRELALRIEEKRTVDRPQSDSDDAYILVNPNGTRPPVFMLPGSDGVAITVHPLAKALGPDQPAYILQSQGLEDGREPLYDLSAIVERFVAVIERETGGRPYFLVGICLGAVVSWELSSRLREKGIAPRRLLLADPMTLTPPLLQAGDGGAVSLTARIRYRWDCLKHRHRGRRKMFFRDRLGIRSEKDRRDPMRRQRRIVRQANIYACRNAVLSPYTGDCQIFLTKDNRNQRKISGRNYWTRMFEEAGNPTRYISGGDVSDFLTGSEKQVFADILVEAMTADSA